MGDFLLPLSGMLLHAVTILSAADQSVSLVQSVIGDYGGPR